MVVSRRLATNSRDVSLESEVTENAMKYYVAHAFTRDGEHEYGEQFVLVAANEREAVEQAKHYLLDLYGDADEDAFDEGDELDLFVRIVKFEGVREISKGEYEVLRKYLGNL